MLNSRRVVVSRVFLKTSKNHFYSTFKTSHSVGSATNSLNNGTISSFFRSKFEANKHLEMLKVSHEKMQWDYADMENISNGLANGFLDARIKTGTSLSVLLKNWADNFICQIAASKAGVLFTPNSPSSSKENLHSVLVQARSSGFLFRYEDHQNMFDALLPEAYSRGPEEFINVYRYPHLKFLLHNSTWKYVPASICLSRIVVSHPMPDPLIKLGKTIKNTDPVMLLQKDDTFVTLSHRTFLNNAAFLSDRLGIKYAERVCNDLPLWTPFGQIACLTILNSNASLTIASPEVGNANDILECIARDKCSTLFTLSSSIESLLKYNVKPETNLSSLTKIFIVQTPESKIDLAPHLKSLRTLFPQLKEIRTGFATAHSGFFLEGDASTGGIGTILPHCEAKIVDANNKEVLPGQAGKLITKGIHTPSSDWLKKQEIATWLDTGVSGKMDTNGNFFIDFK